MPDRMTRPGDVFSAHDEEDPFQRLLEGVVAPAAPLPSPASATVARLAGFDVLDRPLVGGLEGLAGEIVPSRSTVPLATAHVGREVLVVCLDGDLRRPVVIGVFDPAAPTPTGTPAVPVPVEVDGQRLVLRAEREIVLECGDSSITLQRSGRIVVRGRDILSRSSGLQRIKGAAVDIN